MNSQSLNILKTIYYVPGTNIHFPNIHQYTISKHLMGLLGISWFSHNLKDS